MFERLKSKSKINEFDRQLLSSNLVGVKSLEQLAEIEREITDAKTRELKNNPIKGNFDYEHLKEINKYLFKDVYEWAGKDRYDIGIRGDFRKGDTHFTPGDKLPEVSKSLFDALQKENYFKNLAKDDFLNSATSFMNGLNMLHPFREGNGRTQRIFIEQLAKNAGYELDLSNVNKHMMIQASIQAGKGNLKGIEIIISKNLIQTAQNPSKIDLKGSIELLKDSVNHERDVEYLYRERTSDELLKNLYDEKGRKSEIKRGANKLGLGGEKVTVVEFDFKDFEEAFIKVKEREGRIKKVLNIGKDLVNRFRENILQIKKALEPKKEKAPAREKNQSKNKGMKR